MAIGLSELLDLKDIEDESVAFTYFQDQVDDLPTTDSHSESSSDNESCNEEKEVRFATNKGVIPQNDFSLYDSDI